MVDGINIANTQSTNFFDKKKFQNISYAPVQISQPHKDNKDTVVVNKKAPVTAQPMSKLQMVTIVLGGMASAAVIAYFTKALLPAGGSKQLLKRILKADAPDNVRSKLIDEYNKFKKSFMDVDNSQNYIDNVLKLNWAKPQEKVIDIEKARKTLDEEHVGLDKVKNEIIAFIKTRNYNLKHGIKNNGPLILCLDGPPGVGKTSIAESIAKAMEKPFERISLAGVSYKSFIKGSERLYKGSEPGQIIKAMQNSKVSNPVILIDEIDKMGSSRENGSPAFALLDILEPKQCAKFTDEYLELPYDLSNATFVITSNDLRNIPDVLRDRLSIIHIPPYTKQEKLNICKFNIQKMLKELKMEPSQVKFSNEGIKEIVNQTKDRGARRTIENVKSVFTNIIQRLETDKKSKNIVVDRNFVIKSLKNKAEDTSAEVADDLTFSADDMRKALSELGIKVHK